MIQCEPSRTKGEEHSRLDSRAKVLRHAWYFGEKVEREMGGNDQVKK